MAERRQYLRVLPRLAVLVLAVVCISLEAPTWFATPIAVTAAVAVIEPAARRRRGIEAWIVGLGGLLFTLVLLALLLTLLPGGITRVSWAIGLGLCGAGTLAASAYLARHDMARTPWKLPKVRALRGYAWYAAVVPVIIAALVISVRATNTDQAPPLALAARYTDGNAAQVVVSSTADSGPLSLELVAAGNTQRLDGTFRVGADRSVTRSFAVAQGGRVTVKLTDAGSGATLRMIVLQPS